MPLNLRGRSLLNLMDLEPAEIRMLLRLAADLKTARRAGTQRPALAGKHIALIFEKPSTRTRTGFEVAAQDQGAHVTYLGPGESQLGHKESVRDTARVLGRLYDGIEYRGHGQELVDALARHAGVPVYNGLTAEFHPTQVLGDFMTMREFTHNHLSDMKLCFMGDGRGNVANSLLIGAAKVGMNFRLAAPRALWPEPQLLERCREMATAHGGNVRVTESVEDAVSEADFIYTDVWLSMGEPAELWQDRIRLLLPYRVTSQVMRMSGNPHVKFMHCLPAFHNLDTEVAQQVHQLHGIDCMEVTEEVFESPDSIVFDQAENRMHTIKALLVATLG